MASACGSGALIASAGPPPAAPGAGRAVSTIATISAAAPAVTARQSARARADWRAVTAGAAALIVAIVLTARPAPGAAGGGPALAINAPDPQALAIVERPCVTHRRRPPPHPPLARTA